MNCLTDAEIAGYLSDRADADRIERHLAECPACLDLALGAHQLLRGEAAAPERTVQRAIALKPVRRVPSIRRMPRKRNPFLSLAAAAAVVLVAVLAAMALTRRETPPTPTPPVVRKAPEKKETPVEIPVRKEEKKPEEKRGEEKVPERREDPKPETRKESGIADRIPGPKSDPGTKIETVAVRTITGKVRWNDRDLKAGDNVGASDILRTPFGETARLEVGDSAILVHHETELSLAPGPVLRLQSGRTFVRGGIRIETEAGTLTGSDFAVEVSGNATAIVVRSGAVRFASAKGEARIEKGQMLKVTAGQAPGRAARVDLGGALAWVDGAEAMAKGFDEPWLILFPSSKRSPIVVTAPHMPVESQTMRFATGIAERLKTPLVVANGYKRPRKIEVNEPGNDPAIYEEYKRLIRENASVSPVPFLFEVHGYGDENDPAIIEIATTGFTVAELEAIKVSYLRILKKHAPEVEAALVFDLTDPTYDVGGKKVKFKYPAGDMKTKGIFRKDVVSRGWKVELPHACRYRCHEKYEAILAELVESMR